VCHADDENYKVAGDLVKRKPTYVAIGDLHSLPHADEIGLSA
jgi:hypothetical protein